MKRVKRLARAFDFAIREREEKRKKEKEKREKKKGKTREWRWFFARNDETTDSQRGTHPLRELAYSLESICRARLAKWGEVDGSERIALKIHDVPGGDRSEESGKMLVSIGVVYSLAVFATNWGNSTTATGEIIAKSPLTKSATSSPRAKFLCKSDGASSNVKLNQADGVTALVRANKLKIYPRFYYRLHVSEKLADAGYVGYTFGLRAISKSVCKRICVYVSR